MVQAWGDTLINSFQILWLKVADIIPNVLAALIIFIIGWIVGAFVGRLIESIFKALKIDGFLRSAGADDVATRAGLKLNSGVLIGGLVKWFVILAFLIASFNVLGLQDVNVLLQQVVLGLLPRVIIAVIILMVAVVLADAVRKLVIVSARTAGIRSANFIGSAARWIIWIFAAFVALSEVGIADALLLTLFQGIIIAVSLAIGLAFGLGGQDAASDYIEKLREEIQTHEK